MKTTTYLIFYTVCAFILRGSEITLAQKQPMAFERFSVEEGLPQASGYSVAQDSDGFIWFGTQDGLCRYDGYRFLTFRNQTDTTLRGNTINDLLCDKQGRLWIGTTEGLSFKDAHQAHLSIYQPLRDAVIHHFFEDRSGHVWIQTFDRGLIRLSPDRRVAKSFFADTIYRKRMIDMTETPNGQFWIAARTAIARYNAADESFTTYTLQDLFGKTEVEMTLRTLEADADGNLWLGGFDNGVWVIDPSRLPNFSKPSRGKKAFLRHHFIHDKNQVHSLTGNSNRELTRMPNGDMWIGTKDGMTIYRRAEKRFDRYQHLDDDPRSISRNFIISTYRDRQGLVWIGTSGGGFSKYDPARYRFSSIRQLATETNPKTDNMIYAIHQGTDGTLYFGSQGNGLKEFKNEQYTLFQNDGKSPNSLLNNSIYGIADGGDARFLWLATLGGLAKFDIQKRKIVHLLDTKDAAATRLFSVCKLRQKNRLLVSGQKGLQQFDLTTQKWLHWSSNTEGGISPENIIARSIYEDGEGKVWLCTEGKGLILLDVQKESFQSFKLPNATTSRCALDAGQGLLWVGTDNGLILFDKQNFKTIKRYGLSDGLPNELIYSLLKDNEGNLWAATNKGLARLNTDGKTFRVFDVNDGLQSNEFNTNAAFKTADGRLFFGGINGVTAFYNKDLDENRYQAPIKITGFKVFNKDFAFQIDSILDLTYSQNFFSIEFAALNYSLTAKNSYAYQLEGVDPDWVYSGTRHSVSYTDVKAGDYVFKVRGANNDGLWSDETATFHIRIHPAWWQTGWFKWILALVCLGSAYFLLSFYFKTRYRLRFAKLEREYSITQVRNQIAQDIHDELGAGLTKISLTAQVAARMPNASEKELQEKLTGLGRDARNLAGHTREIIFAINPDFDQFAEMQAYFKEVARDFWAETAMELVFDFPKKETDPSVSPDMKRQLLLIFKEAQNNIAKHAAATQVHLTLKTVGNDQFLMEIRDNGGGFEPLCKNGFTKGISGMQERAAKIKAKLTIQSKPNEQTSICVEGKL